jgi:hypothetical protein
MTTKKTGMTIWVSNSCGELFIFNNVPDDPLECGWWEDNNISEVVGNNQNSCEWGAFYGEAKITHIKTPFGGWKEGETKCDNKCGCVLGIDVPIMCWQKGDEEMTLCSDCYCDYEFWKNDENPDNEDEIREQDENIVCVGKRRMRAKTRARTRKVRRRGARPESIACQKE